MSGGGVAPAIDDRRESAIASTRTTNQSQSPAEEEVKWVKILNCTSAIAKFYNKL